MSRSHESHNTLRDRFEEDLVTLERTTFSESRRVALTRCMAYMKDRYKVYESSSGNVCMNTLESMYVDVELVGRALVRLDEEFSGNTAAPWACEGYRAALKQYLSSYAWMFHHDLINKLPRAHQVTVGELWSLLESTCEKHRIDAELRVDRRGNHDGASGRTAMGAEQPASAGQEAEGEITKAGWRISGVWPLSTVARWVQRASRVLDDDLGQLVRKVRDSAMLIRTRPDWARPRLLALSDISVPMDLVLSPNTRHDIRRDAAEIITFVLHEGYGHLSQTRMEDAIKNLQEGLGRDDVEVRDVCFWIMAKLALSAKEKLRMKAISVLEGPKNIVANLQQCTPGQGYDEGLVHLVMQLALSANEGGLNTYIVGQTDVYMEVTEEEGPYISFLFSRLCHVKDEVLLTDVLRFLCSNIKLTKQSSPDVVLSKLLHHDRLSPEVVNLLLDLMVAFGDEVLHQHNNAFRVILSAFTRLVKETRITSQTFIHLLEKLAPTCTEEDIPLVMDLVEGLLGLPQDQIKIDCSQLFGCQCPRRHADNNPALYLSSTYCSAAFSIFFHLPFNPALMEDNKLLKLVRKGVLADAQRCYVMRKLGQCIACTNPQMGQLAAEYLLDEELVTRVCQKSSDAHDSIFFLRSLQSHLSFPLAGPNPYGPAMAELVGRWIGEAKCTDRELIGWCFSVMPLNVDVKVEDLNLADVLCWPGGVATAGRLMCHNDITDISQVIVTDDAINALTETLSDRTEGRCGGKSSASVGYTGSVQEIAHLLLLMVSRQMPERMRAAAVLADVHLVDFLRTEVDVGGDPWLQYLQLLIMKELIDVAPAQVASHPLLMSMMSSLPEWSGAKMGEVFGSDLLLVNGVLAKKVVGRTEVTRKMIGQVVLKMVKHLWMVRPELRDQLAQSYFLGTVSFAGAMIE